jgi:uncharacterized protein (TIGR00290 family)
MKFAMSYSFGKDSALALYKMVKAGNEPVCLITAVNNENSRSWSHGLNHALIQRAASSLRLPVVTAPCYAQDYGNAFEEALRVAAGMGAEGCAFGDMDITAHLEWNKARCEAANMQCLTPLWGIEREKAAAEMISLGYAVIIKVVEKKYLGTKFLGKTVDKALVDRIRSAGADVCGENGEYHTFVTDGPLYREPVSITFGNIVDLGDYAAIEIN